MTKETELPLSEQQPENIRVSNPFVPPGAYREGLQMALNLLVPHLRKKQLKALITRKLMLENPNAKEGQYLQAAAELTVCAWFAYIRPETFVYEPKPNAPKDIDCAFRVDDMQFNVEVKCADYERQQRIRASTDFVMLGHGRLDGFNELLSRMQTTFASGAEPKRLACAHHMDLKLKDYLLSANAKFSPQIDLNHLNVLVVCVDDQMDMNQWLSYLNGARGFFTNDPLEPPEHFRNVDLIVLSNLYHRHHQVASKDRITSHWKLSEAFNLLIRNPNSTKSARLFDHFYHYCPNETNELIDHVVNGESPNHIRAALAIPDYVVRKQMAQGIYRFQGYAASPD